MPARPFRSSSPKCRSDRYGPTLPDRSLPSWFVGGFVALLAWCASAGAFGFASLVAGWYRPAVVGAVATVTAAAVAAATVRRLGPRRRADHRAAIAAVGLVLAFFAFAGVFHSEHLLSDRDPGVYITVGRSIAGTHELKPKTHTGPFAAPAFGDPNTRFDPDFFPMLPVLLAMGWSVGGDTGLLLVGPALGALGLLACYALATRVLGTRAGLLVPVLVVLAPLQLWFARDAYSELLVQAVVLGGLWLYLEARARASWEVAVAGGALVASSAIARIDALAIIAGAVALVALEWVRCDADDVPVRSRRVLAGFGLTLVGVTLVAIATTFFVEHRYVTALGTQYGALIAAFGIAIVLVAVSVVAHRLRPGVGRWAAHRAVFAVCAAAGAAVFVWAYFRRPDPARDLPYVAPGSPIGRLRHVVNNWHFSRSLHWFSAYFGVVAVFVAFAGFVILAWRARRGDSAAATVFLVVVPVAILYIARPSIQPDQPWAMRRYLPVVLPGMAIAVIVALEAGWRASRSAGALVVRRATGATVMVGALLVAVPTVASATPFVHARMQHGAQAAMHRLCRVAGHDSAVLVFGGRSLNVELPEAVRAFCGVPMALGSPTDLVQLADDWHALGRRLLVATAEPDEVKRRAPGSTVVGHYVVSDDDDPERVFDRAPRRFRPVPVEIWLLEVRS